MAAPGYPDELRLEVEFYLERLRFASEPATAGLEEAMRYSLLAGGKRIRPVLALATARAIALKPGDVLPFAAALELIHTYSLIHDDLPAMDDDDLRRGRPTCHRAFGEDVAILAGDGLYAEAFRLMLAEQEGEPDCVLAAARSAGFEPEAVLPAAASIELVHTYSLIHDDLPAMDDDELRRGRPTSHVVYGEDVAILAGDGLFAEAIRHFCERQHGQPGLALAALAELVRATGVGGMVGGQYRDVTLSKADADELRELHSLKTGRLIGASVVVPLILAGFTKSAMEPYQRFAAELGVLFQIVDDILDVTGSDEQLGKPRGSDERHGKLTYVSLFGLERARQLAAESHANARAALAEVEDETADLELVTDFIHTRRR